jgi:hypothetical protein
MLIELVTCPECRKQFIVDSPLWESGIELHCPECSVYFRPQGAAGLLTASQVCKASVPIQVWKPSGRPEPEGTTGS